MIYELMSVTTTPAQITITFSIGAVKRCESTLIKDAPKMGWIR